MNRIGKQTINFPNTPKISATASIVGKKEGEGPLSDYFDVIVDDDKVGESSWEKSESKFQQMAVKKVIEKASVCESDIDMIYGGDLLNQCTGAHYGLKDMRIPFFGLYGACSTFCESMLLSAISVDGGYSKRSICVTSSHFCSAEKQFRMPLNYGGQRPPSAQWTVTASGAAVIENKGDVKITMATPGRIVDMGITDANNMGTAMAPAACDTLTALFNDTKTTPDDYDMIITGDLGSIGSDILCELLYKNGYEIKPKHQDCGCIIYDTVRQDVHSGGSGCGCMASVFCSYIFNKLKNKEINKIILMATGALMNTQALYQGESIPAIAHALILEGDNN